MSSPLAEPSKQVTPPQPQRVLACIMCQQRKVKCNRAFPCSNCLRLGVNCVPATLNPRRRRRRFPERELLDRLHKYEALLQKHNVHFQSLFQETAMAEEAAPGGSGAAYDVSAMNMEDDNSEPPSRAGGSTSTEVRHALSQADGDDVDIGSESRNFWKAIRKGFNNNDADVESVSSDESFRGGNIIIRELWERQFSNTANLFFRAPHAVKANVSTLHPGPVQIFRLWQIYIDNVDPLLKVTHTPSLQGRIVAATANLASVDHNLEALMFSIYCVAIHSLSQIDCEEIFSSSKTELLELYHPACEQALLNSAILRTSDRDCLTAFLLYMISLGHHLEPKSLYTMLGVCMRIGQVMRLDTEAPFAKVLPFEAEMRRRLWWAIVVFDMRAGELAYNSPTTMLPTWNCKVPLNTNDVDFRPESKELPVGQARLSEALFVVVRSEISNALRYMEYFLALSSPALKHMARDLPGAPGYALLDANDPFASLNAMEAQINEKYLQHCDPENALHFMTIWTSRGSFAKYRLIKFIAKFSMNDVSSNSSQANTPTQTDQAPTPTDALRDLVLADALTILESDTQIMTSPLTKGYRWLTHMYFPLPAYIRIAHELVRRVTGERAVEVWETMYANYKARFSSVNSEVHYLHKMFCDTLLQAWDACVAHHRELGEEPPLPRLIARIRQDIADNPEETTRVNAPPTASSTEGQQLPVTTDGEAATAASVGLDAGYPSSLPIDYGAPTVTAEPLFGDVPGQGPFGADGGPPIFPSTSSAAMLRLQLLNARGWPPAAWSWSPGQPWGY